MGYIFGDTQNISRPIALQRGTDTTVSLPAGTYVGNISFQCAVNEVINAGTAPGGNDLLEDEEINAGIPRDTIINRTFNTAVTIYFTGIIASTEIKIYTR